jgi:hypothetical protein
LVSTAEAAAPDEKRQRNIFTQWEMTMMREVWLE